MFQMEIKTSQQQKPKEGNTEAKQKTEAGIKGNKWGQKIGQQTCWGKGQSKERKTPGRKERCGVKGNSSGKRSNDAKKKDGLCSPKQGGHNEWRKEDSKK